MVILLGENGTGKSTVADALEWYFTGDISLLRHEGRRASRRHVGARPEDPTSVAIETTGTLGGELEADGTPTAEVSAAGRETFLLRERTLTEFVERTKGEKWKALAELLGLDGVDQLRLDLQRARNELLDAVHVAEQEYNETSRALTPKVGNVDGPGILAAISRLCSTADVAEPSSLDQALNPTWSESLSGGSAESRAVRVRRLAADISSWAPGTLDLAALERWNHSLTEQSSADRARLALHKAADTLLAESSTGICPLCGQVIDEELLRDQIRAVISELKRSAEELEQAAEGIRGAAEVVRRCSNELAAFRIRSADLGIGLAEPPESPESALSAAVSEHALVEAAAAASYSADVDVWLAAAKRAVAAAGGVVAAPREGTLVELGLLVGLARTWRERASEVEGAREAADYARLVYEAYAERQQAYLTEILDRISVRAAEIYAKLHPGEALADVAVELSGQKGVELAVSFHGSRQKPPTVC